MDMEGWREKIDVLDGILVDLLNRRAGYALEIGKIKKEEGMPVYSPGRERQILERVQELNVGPLTSGAIKRLFERVIDESRRLEREMSEREDRGSAIDQGDT